MSMRNRAIACVTDREQRGQSRTIIDPVGVAISRAAGDVEALCGLVFTGLLSLAILALAVAAMLPFATTNSGPISNWLIWPAVVLAIAVGVAEVASLKLMLGSIQGVSSKKILRLAIDHPVLPITLRPFAFIWWLAHFALIIVLGHFLIPNLRIVMDPNDIQRWETNVIKFFAAIGVSFCTNSYLMLMTASLTKQHKIIQTVFRFRLLADILLCVDLLLPHRGW